ncbi:MAG: UDP-N-acetylmuramate dehydrogenase [Bacteroides sp.]|nr:UDP-N-acetylmuramate dehydrogenase [Bacteroides sp.]
MYREYQNISLLPYHTFGMDVEAARMIEYDRVADLKEIIRRENLSQIRYLHIGGGSNLLFTAPYDGLILHSLIKEIRTEHEDEKEVVLRVGAGMVWDDLVAYCVERGYYGAENLSLIPGEVGASAVQNIGAYGAEAKDIILEVQAIDVTTGQVRIFPKEECGYAYRKSIFKTDTYCNRYIITHVVYRLGKQPVFQLDYGNVRQQLAGYPEINLENVRKAVIEIRKKKLPDPAIEGNAGSFFMNPVVKKEVYERIAEQYPAAPYYTVDGEHVKVPAGWMIEQCGWKGKALGRAAVHDKQALVLVNKGNATSAEVIALAEAVRAAVRDRFGIDIRPEVIYV